MKWVIYLHIISFIVQPLQIIWFDFFMQNTFCLDWSTTRHVKLPMSYWSWYWPGSEHCKTCHDSWIWTDCTNMTYHQWSGQTPQRSKPCGRLHQNGRYNIACSTKHRYICKKREYKCIMLARYILTSFKTSIIISCSDWTLKTSSKIVWFLFEFLQKKVVPISFL